MLLFIFWLINLLGPICYGFHSCLNVSSLIHLAFRFRSTLVSKDLTPPSIHQLPRPSPLDRICILRFIARIFNLMKLAMICALLSLKKKREAFLFYVYIAEGISLAKIWADAFVSPDYNSKGKQTELKTRRCWGARKNLFSSLEECKSIHLRIYDFLSVCAFSHKYKSHSGSSA